MSSWTPEQWKSFLEGIGILLTTIGTVFIAIVQAIKYPKSKQNNADTTAILKEVKK